jgi:hypothetical protein
MTYSAVHYNKLKGRETMEDILKKVVNLGIGAAKTIEASLLPGLAITFSAIAYALAILPLFNSL